MSIVYNTDGTVAIERTMDSIEAVCERIWGHTGWRELPERFRKLERANRLLLFMSLEQRVSKPLPEWAVELVDRMVEKNEDR